MFITGKSYLVTLEYGTVVPYGVISSSISYGSVLYGPSQRCSCTTVQCLISKSFASLSITVHVLCAHSRSVFRMATFFFFHFQHLGPKMRLF